MKKQKIKTLGNKIKVELTVADLCYIAHSVNIKYKELFKNDPTSKLAKNYKKTADKLFDIVSNL